MVERKFEMGMLVAIGMKKTKLMLLLLIESVLTFLTGCLLGIISSIPLVFYFNKHPIRIVGELIVVIFGLIISLCPMYKALRINPVTAMKK